MAWVGVGELGDRDSPAAQVVEQQQPRPGLGGDDADARVGAPAAAGTADSAATASTSSRSSSTSDRAGLARSAARVVRQDVARAPVCERGEGADVVAADDERDDRNAVGEPRAPPSTSAGSVGDRLDVQGDGARCRVVGAGGRARPAAVTSTALPSPTARLTPSPASVSRKARAWLTPPLAATTATRPGRTCGGAGDEARRDAACGARKPEVFGPSTPDPGRRGDGREVLLVADARAAGLGEAAGADQRGPHPGQRPRRRAPRAHAGGRHAEHGEVDRGRRPPRPPRTDGCIGLVAGVDQADDRRARRSRSASGP